VAAEGRLRAAVETAGFLRFFLSDVSWAQLGQSLDDQKPPEWDVVAVRAQGPEFFVESLAADDPLKPVVAAAARDGALSRSMAELSTINIKAICDRRAALAVEAQRRSDRGPGVSRCPARGAGLGAPAQALFSSRDEIYGTYMKEVSNALRRRDRRFDLFVYSHTHRVEDPFQPLRAARLGWDPWVVNTGAWQRVISPAQIAREAGQAVAVLRREPESLPPCYTVVLVRPYAGGAPGAEVRSWRRGATASWGFGTPCGD